MTDIPNPATHAKGLAGKLKGLPHWAYIGAIGVGVGAVWYTYHKNQAAAGDAAADTSGVDDGSNALSATTAGDAYPLGSQGAAYPSDPGTGYDNGSGSSEISDFTDLITALTGGAGITGGGTQASAAPEDHYTPPAITVNIPPSAVPTAPAQSTPAAPAASTHPDPCTGTYPFLQDSGANKGKCYRVDKKNGKDYRNYKGGPNWVLVG